jgi:hypothetical protein
MAGKQFKIWEFGKEIERRIRQNRIGIYLAISTG